MRRNGDSQFRYIFGGLVAIACSLIIAWGLMGREKQVIRARSIVLVDGTGREIVRLDGDNPKSALSVMDESGKVRLFAGMNADLDQPQLVLVGAGGGGLGVFNTGISMSSKDGDRAIDVQASPKPAIVIQQDDDEWHATIEECGFATKEGTDFWTRPDGFWLNDANDRTVGHLTHYEHGLTKLALQAEDGSRIQMNTGSVLGPSVDIYQDEVRRAAFGKLALTLWEGDASSELSTGRLMIKDKTEGEDATAAYFGLGKSGEATMLLRVEGPGTDQYYSVP